MRVWDGRVRACVTELRGVGPTRISNGIAFSPDGRILYHTDSPTACIDAYVYDVTSGQLLSALVGTSEALAGYRVSRASK